VVDPTAPTVPLDAAAVRRNRRTARRVRWSLILGAANLVLVFVALGISAWGVVAESRRAHDAEADEARREVIANALRMGDYDRTEGLSAQHEVLVLGYDTEYLIKEFHQERLDLSPVIYRTLAEIVAFSTSDADLAATFASRVLQEEDASLFDAAFAQRVLADVAARGSEPGQFERHYAEALLMLGNAEGQDPLAGERTDRLTRANRLVSAYVGATRSDGDAKERFCADAELWTGQGDLERLSQVRTNPRIQSQLGRVGDGLTPDELARLGDACP
jgi:hypothetical protein